MGKQVVSVQFLKMDGQESYLLKDLGKTKWNPLPKDVVFARLKLLKEELGTDLYIKIVIPDNSGLSYNEAWDFTKTVLSEFDYYYTDGW